MKIHPKAPPYEEGDPCPACDGKFTTAHTVNGKFLRCSQCRVEAWQAAEIWNNAATFVEAVYSEALKRQRSAA